jgi:hypothetical protein
MVGGRVLPNRVSDKGGKESLLGRRNKCTTWGQSAYTLQKSKNLRWEIYSLCSKQTLEKGPQHFSNHSLEGISEEDFKINFSVRKSRRPSSFISSKPQNCTHFHWLQIILPRNGKISMNPIHMKPIHMKQKRSWLAKAILSINSNAGGIPIFDLKLNYKTITKQHGTGTKADRCPNGIE